MRGDFILYRAKPWDLADWLVARGTNGPYVHCEIDLGDGNFVGEHGTGILVHPQDYNRKSDTVTPVSLDGQPGIDAGMRWVDQVIHETKNDHSKHEYGWLDIVADVFKTMGVQFILRKKGSWDCSHFVALYLNIAKADGPLGYLAKTPETISPNDLARAYGVLKDGK